MLESIRKGDFLETAEYSGNMYGTSKRVVKAIQEQGKVCLLEIDTQGVRQVKQMTDFNPLYVFVKPPSMDDLEERLRARGTETEESLQTRLAAARHEIEYGEQPGNFDTVIVNDDFPRAYKQLRTAVMPLFADLMSDK
ncbi:unnamed protein product [Cyprideis torosa]|uniref:Uncharacterized protein n=1 Tax=Cyprideis torosa TaxID=163714 RepID=A0A7R8W9Z6_9CRUS|nr:unnamed protein product [Cyprideis torosa]CAG0884922.1 unnamed protein product [Cyprideis torosa]